MITSTRLRASATFEFQTSYALGTTLSVETDDALKKTTAGTQWGISTTRKRNMFSFEFFHTLKQTARVSTKIFTGKLLGNLSKHNGDG